MDKTIYPCQVFDSNKHQIFINRNGKGNRAPIVNTSALPMTAHDNNLNEYNNIQRAALETKHAL